MNIRRIGGGGGSGREQASKVCFNFQNGGSCRYGSSCKFSHDPAAAARGTSAQMGSGGGQRVPCRLFQQGRCHYGDRCRFLHTGPTQPAGSHSTNGPSFNPASAPNRDPGTIPVRQVSHSFHSFGSGYPRDREDSSSTSA
jgi:hypothetical protein